LDGVSYSFECSQGVGLEPVAINGIVDKVGVCTRLTGRGFAGTAGHLREMADSMKYAPEDLIVLWEL
jgi:galactokinase